MTLTTEQLKNLSYSGGIVGDLARELLANREAQPVIAAWQHKGEPWRIILDRDIEAVRKTSGSWSPLYTAPPAPAVPDGFKLMPLEMTDEIGEAIAMEARCCGGIALCIYESALAAAPEASHDNS